MNRTNRTVAMATTAVISTTLNTPVADMRDEAGDSGSETPTARVCVVVCVGV